MMTAVKERQATLNVTVIGGVEESKALAQADTSEAQAMFERLARDPNASVEKIERLMALWERSEERKASALFNAAMSAAQQEMKPIATDATNPQTRSRYASYEALDRVLRPIYTKHGFALSFNTGDAPLPDYVRVMCDVSHNAGYSKPYKADMPADGKGAKGGDVMTKTHAVGSAMSYGMRYLLKLIFNVAVGEDDDDGNKAAGSQVREDVKAPEGYPEWVEKLELAAERGMAILTAGFNEGAVPFRNRLTGTDRQRWASIKAKALAVKA